jgi:RNA polymerase sigma factor (sigma-70 family)
MSWRHSAEECEDLTQSFFLHALEKSAFAGYDPSKASFRTFLRLVFERHATNEWKARQTLKRGGANIHVDFATAEAEIAREPAIDSDPEQYFQREWVRSLFSVAVDRLRDGTDATSYALFERYDLSGESAVSYRELADALGLSEAQVTNRLAATRRAFRKIVLEILREVTATDHEFRNEARALLGVQL